MRSSIIRFIFLLFLIATQSFSGIAADLVSGADSIAVEIRKPDPGFTESYLKQKEFSYAPASYNPNLLNQIYDYIREKLAGWDAFMEKIPLILKIFMWLLVIVFLVVVITKSRFYRIFYSEKEIDSPVQMWATTGNQPVDYDEAIREQIGQHQYRLAVRLLYLKAIQVLRVKDYIRYSKEKTNIDYLHDLPREELKPMFLQVTSVFNHVWYGETEIEEEQFARFHQSFQSFYAAVDVQE